MSKDVEPKVTKNEIEWIQKHAPTRGAADNSIGFLIKHRRTGSSIRDLLQEAISTTTEDNHSNLDKAYNFLKNQAEIFDLKEFGETK